MDIDMEENWQEKWQDSGLFMSNPDDRKKMFVTVAYPYPSGAMHIGHGRTYTVPDVYARFKRMQGYNVLFPMAWHVTGAPVVGIAKRIERQDPWTLDLYKNVHKVPENDLARFKNPRYIVDYFSREYKKIMVQMGYSIDWGREFKTTDLQYQKFIQWQFRKLEKKGLVRKGAHPVKYCPECENPVGDHDLLEGEGVGINELTIIKFEIDGMYLVPATFRPETIFGVTNLWLNPDSRYVKIKIDDEEWIISKKAYYNLVHQKKDISIVSEVDANDMIGKHAKNPVTGEKHIILPASFVDPEYASGVVYSVPGHAPADYIALKDLKKNEKLLAKYDLRDEVGRLEPLSIIKLMDFGEFPAQEIIEKFGVLDQNDPKLKDATNELYKLEHTKGVMTENVPRYEGLMVSEAREEIIKNLSESKKGDVMYDFAERPVICRCGGKGVVHILEDQWFLKYSDHGWKETTFNCLDMMKIIPEEVRSNFEYYIDWLQDWACSRRIGLGTKLPWDKRWIIEPLSDSTIYMAYYTISEYLKGIDPDHLDDSFFDEIFLDLNSDSWVHHHDPDLFKNIKEEFEYWYPLNWRLSAKDLIGNHLTFHLFHHSAIFPKVKWPKGAVIFGMGLLEGHKMSSSKGNVILLSDAIETYGADVVRLFLMSSAEPWQDFDWRKEEVKGIKKRLEWFSEIVDKFREINGSEISLKSVKSDFKPEKFLNAWLLSQINTRLKITTGALEGFQTRKAVQEAFFLFRKDLDHYFNRVKYLERDKEAKNEIVDSLAYVLDVWIRIMTPFVPHTCEELWNKNGGQGFVSEVEWPRYNHDLIDKKVEKAEDIIQGLLEDIKEIEKITTTKPEKIHIYPAQEWKWKVLEIANEVGTVVGKIIQKAILMEVYADKKELAGFTQKIAREITRMKYVGRIDEYSILEDSREYLSHETGAKVIIYQDPTYDPENKARNALPYKPAIYIE